MSQCLRVVSGERGEKKKKVFLKIKKRGSSGEAGTHFFFEGREFSICRFSAEMKKHGVNITTLGDKETTS